MQCGHCGTEIRDGFAVCPSCGAHRRQDGRLIGIGLFVLLVGLVASLQAAGLAQYSIAIFIIGVGALTTRRGLRKRWYRHNA